MFKLLSVFQVLLQSSSGGFWQVFKSVAASMFGVQSEQNRQLDFQKTSIVPFVVVGILFVVGFILTIMLVVKVSIA